MIRTALQGTFVTVNCIVGAVLLSGLALLVLTGPYGPFAWLAAGMALLAALLQARRRTGKVFAVLGLVVWAATTAYLVLLLAW